jgi:hypothetical protein
MYAKAQWEGLGVVGVKEKSPPHRSLSGSSRGTGGGPPELCVQRTKGKDTKSMCSCEACFLVASFSFRK